MVDGTAQARLQRATKTKAIPPGQRLDLKVGEEVDFYRKPDSKDASGWMGPAKVTDLTRLTRGSAHDSRAEE